jgi:hypothetical protein
MIYEQSKHPSPITSGNLCIFECLDNGVWFFYDMAGAVPKQQQFKCRYTATPSHIAACRRGLANNHG